MHNFFAVFSEFIRAAAKCVFVLIFTKIVVGRLESEAALTNWFYRSNKVLSESF